MTVLLGFWATPAAAEDLAARIAAASAGDTVTLAPGTWSGPVVIDKPLTIQGPADAVVDGGGTGTVIRITAPDVTLRGFTVRHSGIRQEDIDSGVFADKGADRAVIEDLTVEDCLFGISLRGVKGAVARRDHVVGRSDLRVNERGDGFSVWNAPDSRIEDSIVSGGRDGIRSTSTRGDAFLRNRFAGVRFAVHSMWGDQLDVEGNVSQGNDLGFALMYSTAVRAVGNRSDHDRDHGILLNFTNRSQVVGNTVIGSEKCVFIYNANTNLLAENRFEDCAIGVHFTAGSEGNRFTGNAFIANRTQVMYVGTRALDWSWQGRGNYWSDNPAFDLDGDGIADQPYRPNDIVDRIVWAAPAAKLLLNSPAVAAVRFAQAQFPAVTPGGVVDSAPLMKPPG
ncbi:MAG: nitrous oxide reductase family maturation protein NosD [Actinomycetota bacterium]